MRMGRGRAEEREHRGQEHQFNPWQKIISPPETPDENEVEKETGHPAWIRKYLDLADLMIGRVQRRIHRTSLRRRNQRDAA